MNEWDYYGIRQLVLTSIAMSSDVRLDMRPFSTALEGSSLA